MSTKAFPAPTALAAHIGVALPGAFLRLVQLAHDRRGRRDLPSFTETPLGMFLGGRWMAAITGNSPASHDLSYSQTPPEFIPFGTMGVDGVHYGLIVRAAEIPADDYPVGELCAMDSDPVHLLGNCLAEAIENLASEAMQSREDDAIKLPAQVVRDLEAICQHFSISPSVRKSERRYTRDGDGRPIPRPKTPRSYHFHPTLDGIGVHAPREAFASNTPRIGGDQVSKGIAESKKLIDSNFPASALVILKDLWWANCEYGTIGPMLSEAYCQLNRPAFAACIDRVISKAKRPARRG